MTTAPLTGEPLALDLVNTVASTPGGEVDLTDRFALDAGRIASLEIVPAEAAR